MRTLQRYAVTSAWQVVDRKVFRVGGDSEDLRTPISGVMDAMSACWQVVHSDNAEPIPRTVLIDKLVALRRQTDNLLVDPDIFRTHSEEK